MNSEPRRLGSPRPHNYDHEDNQKDTQKDNELEHSPENSEEKKENSIKAEIISWLQILLTAACIAFVLNTFIIANSRVPTGSMENTIMTNDRVIGSRLSYRFSSPERGDIVIFRFPDDESVYYVKRVIGLPGDTVDIVDGAVYLNGSDTPLEEPYLRQKMEPEEPMHFEVPEDSYFMMGDNRNYSYDARYWTNHFVHKDKLIAKVLFRYWPLNKMGGLK